MYKPRASTSFLSCFLTVYFSCEAYSSTPAANVNSFQNHFFSKKKKIHSDRFQGQDYCISYIHGNDKCFKSLLLLHFLPTQPSGHAVKMWWVSAVTHSQQAQLKQLHSARLDVRMGVTHFKFKTKRWCVKGQSSSILWDKLFTAASNTSASCDATQAIFTRSQTNPLYCCNTRSVFFPHQRRTVHIICEGAKLTLISREKKIQG